MKTLSHPKKAKKTATDAAKIASSSVSASVTRKHHVTLGATDLYIIRRGGNPEESRKLAGQIIADAEKRTTGTDSKKLLNDMRNRRV